MKKIINKLLILLGVIMLVYACGSDDDQTVLSSSKEILGFDLINDGITSVDQEKNVIVVTIPFGTDVTSLAPTIVISENAMVNPGSGEVQDFTDSVTYTVTAQDGSTIDYIVTVEVLPNAQSGILQFNFEASTNNGITEDITGTIDAVEKIIMISVPSGTDVTSLAPNIEISENATVSPGSGEVQDFTDSVTYTVTAQDGSTIDYIVTVEVLPNTQSGILQFNFEASTNNGITEDIMGIIDEVEKIIMISVPFGTDVTSLVPTIVVSENAMVSPGSGVTQDFTNAVDYKVTAEDGATSTTYQVSVSKEDGSSETDREALRAIYYANDSATRRALDEENWDVEDLNSDIATWGGVTIQDGRVVELDLINIDLRTIPSEIGNLNQLKVLVFATNLIRTIPSEIGNLTQLERLDLAGNSLSAIPTGIGNLSNLIELDLNFNLLRILPATIGNLDKLEVLKVEGNVLEELPPEIGNLRSIRNLKLFDNNLSSVPSEIGFLLSLFQLDLRQNPITILPFTICNLLNVEIIVAVDNPGLLLICE